MAGGQSFAQHIAQHVTRQAREKGGWHAQTPERNGGVENRSTGIRRISRLTQSRGARQHIDQSFSAAEDHGVSL